MEKRKALVKLPKQGGSEIQSRGGDKTNSNKGVDMLIIILLLIPVISAYALWMLANYICKLERSTMSVPAYVRFTAVFFAVISLLSIAAWTVMLWASGLKL